jgi:hypothetical protein
MKFQMIKKKDNCIISLTFLYKAEINKIIKLCYKITFFVSFQSSRLEDLSLSDIILDPDGNITYYWLVNNNF